MKVLAGFLIMVLSYSLQAFSAEVAEDFSSKSNLESATAIWNQALGKIHPTLQVVNYTGGGAFTPLPMSVGDGTDGAFEPGTYAHFSSGGDISGNKIRLDTNHFPVLNLTKFYLAAGWILEPIGDQPLIIYSLSDVRIEGEIWCQGRKGGNATGATPGAGGIARCGGKNGGAGGSVGQNGSDGISVTGSVTGGQGGSFAAGAPPSVGGGGGGSWNTSALAFDDPNVTATGGAKGNSVSDPEFTTIAGGAGGGGGGSTNTEAGAGGGAGGGVVIIHAVGNVDIGNSPASATGFIFASGGDGGDSNVGGGTGGGGGAGSVQVFSGDTIHVYNQAAGGASQAEIGHGGTNANAQTGAIGGKGRSWFASVHYVNAAGARYLPDEEAPVVPNDNTVEFTNASQAVLTKSFDLLSTKANIDSFAITPSSADFQMQFNGSSDNFASDQTGWTSNLLEVSNKRYLKLKISIQTSTPANPTMIDQVKVFFTRGSVSDFDFKTSGCGVIGPEDRNRPGALIGLLFLLVPLLMLLFFRLKAWLTNGQGVHLIRRRAKVFPHSPVIEGVSIKPNNIH